VTAGTITSEQYRSSVLRDHDGNVSCVGHVLNSLANGSLVGGNRETILVYLANAEVDAVDAGLIVDARTKGLLTDLEVREVLAHALNLPPLPVARALPKGLQQLPSDFPEPRKDSPMFVRSPEEADSS
jgi:hypothetical protein